MSLSADLHGDSGLPRSIGYLAVHIRGVNVFFLEDDWNAPAFEDPHVLDAVQGVTGKAGNGFRQDEVDFLLPAQFNHFVKLLSFLGADA